MLRFLIFAGVAQLVRALPCHGRGRGFKSHHSRKIENNSVLCRVIFYLTARASGDLKTAGRRAEVGSRAKSVDFDS